MNTRDLLPFAPSVSDDLVPIDLGALRWLPNQAGSLPPYWSRARDRYLRDMASHDIIATAVSLFTQKFLNVPFSIQPANANIQAHAKQAKNLQTDLMRISGMLAGWNSEIAKFCHDYLTQDNGGFLMLMGEGRASGPIEGAVRGVYHLDSQRCTRTGDSTYPVRYRHTDEREYKIHYARVIAIAHQPSPKSTLYGVGLCHLSSCLRFAVEIDNIIQYYAEKMGARPARQILYVKRGMNLEHLQTAINVWRAKMDAEGSELFAQTLLIAPRSAGQEIDLATLDLASAPEGFNRQETVMADNALVAAAFGLDLRDFGYMTISSERSSEAAQQKGYSRGVATLINLLTEQLAFKVLPPHLVPVFDYVDDMQDQLRANIQEVRSRSRSTSLTSGTLSIRVAREQMLDEGELTPSQFNDLELGDGRLPNGLDVIHLFYFDDPKLAPLLDLGVSNPLDQLSYDPLEMLDKIEEKIAEVSQIIHTSRTTSADFDARCALAALTKLRNRLLEEPVTDENTLSDGAAMDDNEAQTGGKEPAAEGVPPDANLAKAANNPLVTQAELRRIRTRLRRHTFLSALFEARVR